jgi:hypothetical protein
MGQDDTDKGRQAGAFKVAAETWKTLPDSAHVTVAPPSSWKMTTATIVPVMEEYLSSLVDILSWW